MERLEAIVKACDVRGRVPAEFDADLAARLGAATATEFGGPELLLARDARHSSPDLASAFADGVRAAGVGVVDLGLATTDLLWFASARCDLPGAMITASHNPPEYNGVKLCRPGAAPVAHGSGLERIARRAAGASTPRRCAAGMRRLDLLDAYARHVRGLIDATALRPLTVVVDASHGTGGLVAAPVLDPLPVRLELRCGEPDGAFPSHPPDPLQPESLAHVAAAVRETGADLGLLLDGDADRLVCVDERGEAVRPSALGAVLAAHLLAQRPGEAVLHDLACSRVVPETIAAHGGRAVRTRVGHSHVRAVMRETGALLGVERSGHYYFRDHAASDSAMVAAVTLLEALSRHGGPLSALVAPYEVYASSGEVSVAVDDPAAAVRRVENALGGDGAVDRLDGVSVDTGAWSVNVRPSNTEPVVRVNVEAVDEAGVAQVLDRVLRLVDPAPTALGRAEGR